VKVLIVDDEPLVRRSLERAFGQKGHTVEVAEDGHDGLKNGRSFIRSWSCLMF
jgi:DNA-binding response OmpR family regulator